jgi:lipoate-protein ligase A
VESLSCRLLPYAAADGPHNMAADVVLLEGAVAGTASLRFYGWSEATLSLGYFQTQRIRQGDARLAALPFVRRTSGGAALVHHHELTYAMAVPAGAAWQAHDEKVSIWLGRVHGIIRSALRDFGVMAQVSGGQAEQPFTGILCFKHVTPGDLLIGQDKIAGSAQRRQHGSLMQHGGILLATSPYAPALPGIRELSGRDIAIEELCLALQRQWSSALSWSLTPVDWTEGERKRINELVATRYSQRGWNSKR